MHANTTFVKLQHANDDQKIRLEKIKAARKVVPEITEEVTKQHIEQTQKYSKSRQPLLKGLASDYDMQLFRDAQARACEQRVILKFWILIYIECVIRLCRFKLVHLMTLFLATCKSC